MLSEPLFSSPLHEYDPSTESEVPFLDQVAIGGHSYQINLDQFQHVSVPVRRNAADTTAQPSDASLSTEGFWVRSATDWTLGAGQRRFDDTELSSQRRFYRSKGVNIWTRHELSMLPETTRIATVTSENNTTFVVSNYVYWADGNNLHFTSNPYAAVPTIGTCPIGAEIKSVTTDGVHIYVGTPIGIYVTTPAATTAALFSMFHTDLVAIANGRLFATMGGRVVEVDAAGEAGGLGQLDDSTRVKTTVFTAILSAPNGVYLAGSSGDRASLYFIGVNPQTGESLPPTWAGDLPDGEIVNAMTFYGGNIVLGTTAGVRLGVITGPDSVVPADVIDELGSVEAVDGQGRFVWCSWSNYDNVSTGLARLGLGEFAEPYKPAYASDLMATTQGRVVGICTFQGRHIFAVASDGIYVEQLTKVPQARISSGEVSWGSVIRKSAAGLNLRHSPLEGSVDVSLTLEDDTVLPVGRSDVVDSLSPATTMELFDAEGEFVSVELTLNRSAENALHGPVIRHWSMSCFIRPTRQDQFLIPVRLFSGLTNVNGIPRDIDTLEEFRYLKSLEQSGTLTQLRIGASTYRVQVVSVEMRAPDKWNDSRSFFDGMCYVTCMTQEPGV